MPITAISITPTTPPAGDACGRLAGLLGELETHRQIWVTSAAALGWDSSTPPPPPGEVCGALMAALLAARNVLEHAETTCRYHGTNPPERLYGGGCGTCEQPTRVRAALAALSALAPAEVVK